MKKNLIDAIFIVILMEIRQRFLFSSDICDRFKVFMQNSTTRLIDDSKAEPGSASHTMENRSAFVHVQNIRFFRIFSLERYNDIILWPLYWCSGSVLLCCAVLVLCVCSAGW